MEDNDNIAVAYVQRQEQLLVEQIRKNIQLEVSYKNLVEKHNEAVTNAENNMEMIKQLSASLELLTIERDDLKKADSQLRARIDQIQQQCDDKIRDIRAEADQKVNDSSNKATAHVSEYTNQIGELNTKLNTCKTEYDDLKKKYDSLNREFERQKTELQQVFDENNKLKKK